MKPFLCLSDDAVRGFWRWIGGLIGGDVALVLDDDEAVALADEAGAVRWRGPNSGGGEGGDEEGQGSNIDHCWGLD